MTATTKPLTFARPGMSTQQAADFIRHHFNLFLQHKDRPHDDISRYDRLLLRDDIRDAGWCLVHSGGWKAMTQAHDLAIKGLRDPHRYNLSRAIDTAFNGIGDWRS